MEECQPPSPPAQPQPPAKKAKKAGTKLKYAPITNSVGAYTKAQIKAYWKTEKAKKRAELDEANEKAQIAAMARIFVWSPEEEKIDTALLQLQKLSKEDETHEEMEEKKEEEPPSPPSPPEEPPSPPSPSYSVVSN